MRCGSRSRSIDDGYRLRMGCAFTSLLGCSRDRNRTGNGQQNQLGRKVIERRKTAGASSSSLRFKTRSKTRLRRPDARATRPEEHRPRGRRRLD